MDFFHQNGSKIFSTHFQTPMKISNMSLRSWVLSRYQLYGLRMHKGSVPSHFARNCYLKISTFVCGFNCELRLAVCGLKKGKCYSVGVSLSKFLKSFPKCTANAWRPSQTLSQNERAHFQRKMLTKRKNEMTFFWVADWWLKLEKLREECKTLRSFRTLKLVSRTFVISCKKEMFDQNF